MTEKGQVPKFVGYENLDTAAKPVGPTGAVTIQGGKSVVLCRVHGYLLPVWTSWNRMLVRCCPLCIREKCKITEAIYVGAAGGDTWGTEANKQDVSFGE